MVHCDDNFKEDRKGAATKRILVWPQSRVFVIIVAFCSVSHDPLGPLRDNCFSEKLSIVNVLLTQRNIHTISIRHFCLEQFCGNFRLTREKKSQFMHSLVLWSGSLDTYSFSLFCIVFMIHLPRARDPKDILFFLASTANRLPQSQ